MPQRFRFSFSSAAIDEVACAKPRAERQALIAAKLRPSLRFLRGAIAGCFVLLTAVGAVRAQTFPDRPVRLILGFAAGGLTDTTGRIVAQGMSKFLGQTVVPENRPGSAGVMAASVAANAAPDGYTMILVDPGTLTNPLMRKNAPYKMSDLKAIGMIGATPVVIVTSNELPVHSMKELVDYGRKNPGLLSYGSPGPGSVGHLAAELLLKTYDIKATHVPYPGTSQMMPDLMSNRVPLGFSTVTSAGPLVAQGKIRAIATTGSKRTSSMPDLQTVAEGGYPELTVDIWLALATQKGVPDAIVRKLNEALLAALADPAAIASLRKLGIDASPSSPGDASKLWATDDARWLPIIEAAGLKDRL
jgi:tripartite-type tricarboxylate transporter receptor subunit TctC